MTVTDEERAAFKIRELQSMYSLMCPDAHVDVDMVEEALGVALTYLEDSDVVKGKDLRFIQRVHAHTRAARGH